MIIYTVYCILHVCLAVEHRHDNKIKLKKEIIKSIYFVMLIVGLHQNIVKNCNMAKGISKMLKR